MEKMPDPNVLFQELGDNFDKIKNFLGLSLNSKDYPDCETCKKLFLSLLTRYIFGTSISYTNFLSELYGTASTFGTSVINGKKITDCVKFCFGDYESFREIIMSYLICIIYKRYGYSKNNGGGFNSESGNEKLTAQLSSSQTSKSGELPKGIFKGCQGFRGNTVGSVSLKYIGDEAFAGSTIKYFSLAPGSKLESIGENAFEGCAELEVVDLREASIDRTNGRAKGDLLIGSGAFRRCLNLKKIWLPDTLEKINLSIFEDCPALEEIKCFNSTPHGYVESPVKELPIKISRSNYFLLSKGNLPINLSSDNIGGYTYSGEIQI